MSEPLPAGWVWSNLEETCASAGGGTPSKAEPAFWTSGTIPWVSPKDMKARVISSSEDRVTESALERLTLIPTGSLLLVVRSGILSRTLPVAVTALPVTVNQDMRAFIPRAGMSSDFLAWQLIGKERDVLAATSKDGTTVASIEAPALARFPLAIAPAAEQTRIVAKLEELLSDLDTGVAELKAAQAKLRRYRQSLLKAAVEGALTQAWRAAHPAPVETGAQLLERILRERRARWEAQQLAKFESQGKAPPKGWRENYGEPLGPELDGRPALPAGWTWASLEQVASDEKYSLAIGPFGSNLTVPDYRDEGVPLVFVRNIRSGQFGGQSTRYVTSEKAYELTAHQVAAGDVLITKMGEPPGDACVYPDDQPIAVITADCIKVRCAEGLMLPKFLEAVVNSHIGKDQVKPMTQGVAQKKVSLGRFSKLAVPVPPLQEQVAILLGLYEAEREERSLTIALERALQQSTAQRQNLLRAAFAGQLVPQDPADEPAAVLLARIRAERAAQGVKPKARKPRPNPEAA